MGRIKEGKLKIELQSDLCAGSGCSYAGIVDSDSCYDEYGMPYIPARRIRGCMRETAETLLYSIYDEHKVEALFGYRGNDHSSDFVIGNAYVEEYYEVRSDLEKLSIPEITAQSILDRYSHVVGQTRIEKGIADEGSLRYTRVINQYSPVREGENISFVAEISYDEEDESIIEDIVKATRHIGLKRNRGFGNVKMHLINQSKKEEKIHKDESFFDIREMQNGKVEISFALTNTAPLMLSNTDENTSRDYISGQQVLGLLAGRYLKNVEGANPDSEEFRTLFLNGETIYTNLYPFDGNYIYYPAPDYLNRLKKTKKLVYVLGDALPEDASTDKEEYKYGDGNQPKKLKGRFASITNHNEVRLYETLKDVVYHHSHRNKHQVAEGSGEEGILYSMETLRKGQKFAGSIVAPKEKKDLILKLLSAGDLFFGKSKSAQYGKCKLIPFKGEKCSNKQEGVLVVTFLSDTIIYNKEGQPTVDYEDIRKAVAEQLGIPDNKEPNAYISSIQTTLATGYVGVWNLRKAVLPAIKAGSYLVFENATFVSGYPQFVGERNLEGYGQVDIRTVDGMTYMSPSPVPKYDKDSINSNELAKTTKELVIPIIFEQWLDERINKAIIDNKIKVSNTSAGRFVLMLKESTAAYRNNSDEAFMDFVKRIESIKSDATRKEGEKLYQSVGTSKGIGEASLYMKETAVNSDKLSKWGEKFNAIGIKPPRISKEKKARWNEYVMAILVDRKYKGSD